jgi:hypothetical protein
MDCTDEDGNESSRALGLVVARGTLLVLVSPVDGSEEIANPFVQQEEWFISALNMACSFTMDGGVLEGYFESDLQASSQYLAEYRDCKNINQVAAISSFMTGIVTQESSLNDTGSPLWNLAAIFECFHCLRIYLLISRNCSAAQL